jgi:hypothetical protein
MPRESEDAKVPDKEAEGTLHGIRVSRIMGS